LAHGVKTLG